ncbi:uncharacterized protein [Panulirus ornatus]|uniref:uncharacterized protein n=1 Tax=Panulirus ornatus TaxID=150431 RepID=UPI003A84F141
MEVYEHEQSAYERALSYNIETSNGLARSRDSCSPRSSSSSNSKRDALFTPNTPHLRYPKETNGPSSDMDVLTSQGNVLPNQNDVLIGSPVGARVRARLVPCNGTAAGGAVFHCGPGECISSILRCNGVPECTGSEDESVRECGCLPNEFQCAETCIDLVHRCNTIPDCPDGTDEDKCETFMCPVTHFKCNNHFCVPSEDVCDFHDHCGDGSDEHQCHHRQCWKSEFECANGQCIRPGRVCDGKQHCKDGSDESACQIGDFAVCESGAKVHRFFWCDAWPDCPDNHADELHCGACDVGSQFRCPSSRCIPASNVCDSLCDCYPDCTDEANCTNAFYTRVDGVSRCEVGASLTCMVADHDRSWNRCIARDHICDGHNDCHNGQYVNDEFGCASRPLRVTFGELVERVLPDTVASDTKYECFRTDPIPHIYPEISITNRDDDEQPKNILRDLIRTQQLMPITEKTATGVYHRENGNWCPSKRIWQLASITVRMATSVHHREDSNWCTSQRGQQLVPITERMVPIIEGMATGAITERMETGAITERMATGAHHREDDNAERMATGVIRERMARMPITERMATGTHHREDERMSTGAITERIATGVHHIEDGNAEWMATGAHYRKDGNKERMTIGAHHREDGNWRPSQSGWNLKYSLFADDGAIWHSTCNAQEQVQADDGAIWHSSCNAQEQVQADDDAIWHSTCNAQEQVQADDGAIWHSTCNAQEQVQADDGAIWHSTCNAQEQVQADDGAIWHSTCNAQEQVQADDGAIWHSTCNAQEQVQADDDAIWHSSCNAQEQVQADDDAIWHSSCNAQEQVQAALDHVHRWAIQWSSKFSATKSISVVFTRKNKIPNLQLEQLNNQIPLLQVPRLEVEANVPPLRLRREIVSWKCGILMDRRSNTPVCRLIIEWLQFGDRGVRPLALRIHSSSENSGITVQEVDTLVQDERRKFIRNSKTKDLDLFKCKEAVLKKQRPAPIGSIVHPTTAALRAANEVSPIIAKQKKTHTTGEDIPSRSKRDVQLNGSTDVTNCAHSYKQQLKQMFFEMEDSFFKHVLKALPGEVSSIVSLVVKRVDHVEGCALTRRLFKLLCEDFGAAHSVHLFHTNVSCLSRGNVTKRVYELRSELLEFFQHSNKHEDFVTSLDDHFFLLDFVYHDDIFDALNMLNQSLQRTDATVYELVPKLRAVEGEQSEEFPCRDDRENKWFHCLDGRCLPHTLLCDYKYDCLHGEDELHCGAGECAPGEFTCSSGQCIPGHYRCQVTTDKRHGCVDLSHLLNCSTYECGPHQLKCGSGPCLGQERVCDDRIDCPLTWDDEDYCPFICSASAPSCECKDISISCEGRGLTHLPQDIELQISRFHMSGNYFNHSLDDTTFQRYRHLVSLHLAGNRLVTLQAWSLYGLSSLSALDLSSQGMTNITRYSFLGLRSVLNMNLSHNQLHNLPDGTFSGVSNLLSLDLRGNPVDVMGALLFSGLVNLNHLWTDEFRFCCLARHVRHCRPHPDEFSSCEDLLTNSVLRVCIWVLTSLSLTGNLLVIIWRTLYHTDNKVHSFLITNLALGDLCMGLYLLIIAAVDVSYRGVYFIYDAFWRNSPLCQLAGFLSTFSSELSVFTLTAITLERFAVIIFPFRVPRLSMGWTKVIMGGVWLCVGFLAALPLTDIHYFRNFYGRSGVCLALHITHEKPNGWEYSVFVFLVLNLVSFSVIAGSYWGMYRAAHNSSAAVRNDQQLRESSMARKMTLIVVTDAACWLPIIFLGLASLAGITIPPQVFAWVAVFVLPLNAAINPLLYTLSTAPFLVKARERVLDVRHSLRRSALLHATSASTGVTAAGEATLIFRPGGDAAQTVVVFPIAHPHRQRPHIRTNSNCIQSVDDVHGNIAEYVENHSICGGGSDRGEVGELPSQGEIIPLNHLTPRGQTVLARYTSRRKLSRNRPDLYD